jgi:hypothetical protein
MKRNAKVAINKVIKHLYLQLEDQTFTKKEIDSFTIQFKYTIERLEKIAYGNTTQLIDEPIRGVGNLADLDLQCWRCDQHGCHKC